MGSCVGRKGFHIDAAETEVQQRVLVALLDEREGGCCDVLAPASAILLVIATVTAGTRNLGPAVSADEAEEGDGEEEGEKGEEGEE